MTENNQKTWVAEDPWKGLRRITDARIALGRAGSSLPLAAWMAFKLDHARARDAVHSPFQQAQLARELQTAGMECVQLESEVAHRMEYLTRPDKGRRLSTASRDQLKNKASGCDICLVIGDGLSARAIHENAREFTLLAVPLLHRAGFRISPICLVRNARVAIGDEIGEILGARLTVMLIGERPGLSAPNSMGVYMTMHPRTGTTDERRNCISNIRQGGLPPLEGVRKLGYLVEEAFKLGTSGVELKDRMTAGHLPFGISLESLTGS
ncbi:ethanolamine ammonia-lyase subunit EutC [Desulfoplanes formicivorans]|uniref:Ethanolamine ammonia-lyase small subunit n=1 Tax=Desulfoplanes formicivorans TaxID=1592317 RepID=A0A194AJK9_9BACT|nr:ethanolamine ammonia-lyase subunit EutC [Desulfoplanes formicivorans]GAU09425.1 ethanolamine ammonia-lyase small subunit [Desulfoplanes formicivorans]